MIIDLDSYIWGYGKCIIRASDPSISAEEVHLFSNGRIEYEFLKQEIKDDFDYEIFIINNGVRPIVEINDIALLNYETANTNGSMRTITEKLFSIINSYLSAKKHPMFNMLVNVDISTTSYDEGTGVSLNNMYLDSESLTIKNIVEKKKFGQIIDSLKFKRSTPMYNISTAGIAEVAVLTDDTLDPIEGLIGSDRISLTGIA